MEIHEIRKQNYRALLQQFRARAEEVNLPEHGLLKRFAEHVGVSARYLSHINNDRKRIGVTLARQLEAGLGLGRGWLDTHHTDAAQPSDGETEFLSVALRLFRESPADAQAMLMHYMLARIEAKAPIKAVNLSKDVV